jgi:hypothetical protein
VVVEAGCNVAFLGTGIPATNDGLGAPKLTVSPHEVAATKAARTTIGRAHFMGNHHDLSNAPSRPIGNAGDRLGWPGNPPMGSDAGATGYPGSERYERLGLSRQVAHRGTLRTPVTG